MSVNAVSSLFKGISSSDKDLIRRYIPKTISVNNYAASSYSQELQEPGAAQIFYPVNVPNSGSFLITPTFGPVANQFNLPTAIGHCEDVFGLVTMTNSTGSPVAAQLAPYLWWTNYKLFYGTTIIFNNISPIFMFYFYFMKMRDQVRNRLLRLATDTTLSGVQQAFVWPTPWSPIINGVNAPPMPIRTLTNAFTFQWDCTPNNQWVLAAAGPTPYAGNITVNLQVIAKSVVFNGDHEQSWTCAFENPIPATTPAIAFSAGVAGNVFLNTIPSRTLKALLFVSQKNSDLATTVMNYWNGQTPSAFTYNPQGGFAFNLPTLPSIILCMLTQWLGMDMYNTTTTITNTWENSFFFAFGPRYSINDIWGSYLFVSGNDQSNCSLTYPAASVMTLVGIAYQILTIEGGQMKYAYGDFALP